VIKEGKELNDIVCTAYRMGCDQTREVYQKRIEKLEAALAHIYAWYPVSVSDPAQTIKDIGEFARNALEGKDD
jgi:hypothetical protein